MKGLPIKSVYCLTTSAGVGPMKKKKSSTPPIALKVIAGVGCNNISEMFPFTSIYLFLS